MKPLLLHCPDLNYPPHTEEIRAAHKSSPGDIESSDLDSDSWDSKPFFDYLRKHGYRSRDCQRYGSLSLTYVNGSCRWHDDPGFGLVACWLIYSENLWGNDAQLVTRHGPVDIREGRLCIFDANQGHAWLSNGVCVMVMATIAPVRRCKP